MKKIFFLAALIILFSCEKEAKYCWSCVVTTKTTNSGSTVILSSTREECDMSTREMEIYEQGSTTGNTKISATCTKL
jgi:hypothetical protein